MTPAGDFLVSNRLVQSHVAMAQTNDQISRIVDRELARAFRNESDHTRARARRHDEVLLQLSLVPVIDLIHSGIYVVKSYAFIQRHIGMPFCGIFPDEIVSFAVELASAFDLRFYWRAGQ